MKILSSTHVWAAVLVAALPLPGSAQDGTTQPKVAPHAVADAREVALGVLFDDFESGDIGQLTIDDHRARRPKVLKVVPQGRNKALFLSGNFHTRVYFADRSFRNCVVETRINKGKGSYAGVVLRDKLFVYLQMRGALCVNHQHGKLQFQSAQAFRGYHDLKVVCIGPIMRAYMDGKLICTERVEDRDGRVGVYAHNADAHYDYFRVTTKVEPVLGLFAEPQAAGDALVFAPGRNVSLGVSVSNFSAQEQGVSVMATAMTWGDEVLGKKGSRDVRPGAGDSTVLELDLGRVPAGFHQIVLTARSAKTEVARADDLPLAVQERGACELNPPAIPVAVYSKYFGKRTPLYQNTYTHAIGKILRDHHFNAIVADPAFTREMIDIFQSYGIATIARGGGFLDHSAVMATLQGDEPKRDQIARLKTAYEKLAQASGKPVTTCMVGEAMALGGDHDPVNIWIALNARLRALRWYGIKKSHYNLLYDLKYKGWLPLSSVMRIVEASSDTPWWFVPPSFGRTNHEGYFMNPTPAEMRGLMHLAMSHGADGMMLWCLQSWGNWPALIEQQSLKPTDGKLAAASEAAALIVKHADLLSSLCYGAFEVRNLSPIHVEAVPRRSDTGAAYMYVVNKDAAADATAKLAFKGGGPSVQDLFSGRTLKTIPAPDGVREVELTLGPCRAALLDLALVAPKPSAVEPLRGDPMPDRALIATTRAAIEKHGVAVLRVSMAETPCIPGDAIGLSRADDPRRAWEKAKADPRCLSWSGHLHERTAPGYLPLRSALRVADANGATSYWTIYPAVNRTRPGANELRAMLHLALAYGSKAALVSDAIGPELATVVNEVARLAAKHGKLIAGLHHGGLDVRCKNPLFAAIPQSAAAAEDKRVPCVYAVNLDTENPITAEILLWDDVWDWTTARDAFSGAILAVSPRDEEGYLSCTITLRPGEGKLIETDAHQPAKRRK